MAFQVIRVPIQQERTGKTIQDNAYFDSVNQSIQSLVPVGPYANDAAAAAAGVPKMGLYYDGAIPAVIHIRLV